MNVQTHYPDCWRDPYKHPECALRRINELEQEARDGANEVEEIRRMWQPYTQQNVDRMSLEDLVADMIGTVKELEQEVEELRHDIKRHIASVQVESEDNGYLRTMLDKAQRELGRMEAKHRARVAEMERCLIDVYMDFHVSEIGRGKQTQSISQAWEVGQKLYAELQGGEG